VTRGEEKKGDTKLIKLLRLREKFYHARRKKKDMDRLKHSRCFGHGKKGESVWERKKKR